MANLFAIPPGQDFAACFADGYYARFGELPPLVQANASIWVNTTRARTAIEEALADRKLSQGLLPRMVLIPDLATLMIIADDLPAAVSGQQRLLHLTRLVEAYLHQKSASDERVAPLGAASHLAAELALLIDQFHDFDVPIDRLDQAVMDLDPRLEGAHHWKETLKFVDIVRKSWPSIRDGDGDARMDGRERQRAVMASLIDRWQMAAPDAPVIAAGSTGSVGSTADLLAAIAQLQDGYVVLPGFDPDIDPSIWEAAEADHPMGPFRGVFERLEVSPGDVEHWSTRTVGPRVQFMAQALRPAPVTDQWHSQTKPLAEMAADAMTGLAVLEAENARSEASAIALAVREALETPDRQIVLITPDAAISRRTTAELQRFGIVPDDTVGQPLAQTPPGVLARLLLDVAMAQTDQVGLAALLQHPLVRLGHQRGGHIAHLRAFEAKVLRGFQTRVQPSALPEFAEPTAEQIVWQDRLHRAIGLLAEALAARRPFADLLAVHQKCLEKFTDVGDGSPVQVWEEVAGEALRKFFDELQADAFAYGTDSVPDYGALLFGLMRGVTVRPRLRERHPRVRVSGPREARIEDADFVILAGLNDGTWPAAADPGPWLSRPMHAVLGLPLPERSVGLSAHDFFQAVCRPNVLITRAKRVDGSPTVASRWLVRLETLLNGVDQGDVWKTVCERGSFYQDLASVLAQPGSSVLPAPRPRPITAPEAFPQRLSVTEIETLVRDPYAVYAKRVLHLKPLEPLGRRVDARERGTVFHTILERFVQQTAHWPGIEQSREILFDAADEVLAQQPISEDLRRIWRSRISRFSRWLLVHEDARRAEGVNLDTEVPGKLPLQIGGRDFALSAKADRIDMTTGGRGAIYDYKSGAPPTTSQMNAGFAQQLHLQSAILAAGGFDPIPPMVPGSGAYIGLTGSGDGGKQTQPDDLSTEVPIHLERAVQLLAAFQGGAPWISQARPQTTQQGGDYDHLARRAEWQQEDDA